MLQEEAIDGLREGLAKQVNFCKGQADTNALRIINSSWKGGGVYKP